jgi:hypothetical protein
MPRRKRSEPEPWVKWEFYDFVSERGTNEIQQWSTAQGPTLKARLNALIRHLETLERVFSRADNVAQLRKPGPCHGCGLIELTITIGKVQYRPIGCYGPRPREITLLIGAIEKGDDFEPRDACVRAVNRKNLVLSDRRYIVVHDLN